MSNAPEFPGVRLGEAPAVMLTVTPHLQAAPEGWWRTVRCQNPSSPMRHKEAGCEPDDVPRVRQGEQQHQRDDHEHQARYSWMR